MGSRMVGLAATAALLSGAAACGQTAQPPASRPTGTPRPSATAAASPDPGLQLIEHTFVDFRQYTEISKFRSSKGTTSAA